MSAGAERRMRAGQGAWHAIVARLRDPAVSAVLAFVVAFSLAGVVATFVTRQWQAAAEVRFTRRAAALHETLRQALIADESILRGARALLEQTPGPDPATWKHFVAAIDLDNSRSAITALGYVTLYANPAAGAAGSAEVATQWAGLSANLPANAFAQTDATRAARRYAAETGNAALAALPALANAPPLLTLWLPVYETAPDAQGNARKVIGFAVALLDARRLFAPLVAADPGLVFSARIGTPPLDLYTGERGVEDEVLPGKRFRRNDPFVFGGATLALDVSADASPVLTGAAACATAILLAGALGAAAFAFFAQRLMRVHLAPTKAAGDARLNEARMMGIIRSSMEAIVTVDDTQRVVIFNPAAEQVFGLSAMEAIGSPLSRFIPERFRAAHAQHVEQFGETGVTERQMGRPQRVLHGLRANGEEFPIEASISQIRDDSGKLFTVVLRDITERVRAEEALTRSREELRELSANLQNVREAEKTRIARELHDDLGQQLTALKIDLSALERRLGESDTSDVPARLAGMRNLIDSTVGALRRIAADLRPVMLDDLGLVPAIEWLANDFTNRYGIAVERDLDADAEMFSNAASSALFRIVQEALTNVARHADASLVEISLKVDGPGCVLRIADDGLGATGDPADPASTQRNALRDKSFGLLGIRERAHMLDGTVSIATAPGKGFAMTITFALHALLPEEAAS
ncbi:PAS domain-containing sensor histidine kinase [Paraburkholderia silvatlantica]|uniref:PAS domain S-box-containing protein n=1 Tax=Paraburkholderia silvatlantica TaxID=321895 RepID=A0A2V4TS61_9BURK|nr:PAS domain S-box protein [Paraburkholderia silvatlantica]PYE14897.1 PAS domain S-box-containing protein [Paraburkholderia silvatlantica]TDR04787.1 PAS domain S-box-containing protein [Paraburkholderia silvatlantica]